MPTQECLEMNEFVSKYNNLTQYIHEVQKYSAEIKSLYDFILKHPYYDSALLDEDKKSMKDNFNNLNAMLGNLPL